MKVYISHAHTDDSFVSKVEAGLEKVGLEVWNANREVLPGDNWVDKIAQALKESEAMVVLVTPDALRSNWVRWEIEYALGERGYRKRLIPVLVRKPEGDIPWILRRLPMIDMEEFTEEVGINQISQALLKAAQSPTSMSETP